MSGTPEKGPFAEPYWFNSDKASGSVFHYMNNLSVGGGAKVYAVYGNGVPAVFEIPFGKGKVMALNFVCSDPVKGPVKKPEFVMILARAAQSLLASDTENRALRGYAGESLSVNWPVKNAPILVKPPVGKPYEAYSGESGSLTIPRLKDTGVWEFRSADDPERNRLLAGIGISPTESDFGKAPPMAAVFRKACADRQNKDAENGLRISAHLMIAALALMAVELLLSGGRE